MKSSIVIIALMMFLTSCGEPPKVAAPQANLGAAKPVENEFKPSLQVMNYNEFNSNMQKLTGVNINTLVDGVNKTGENGIVTLYEQLKGTLPSSGDIDGMTSFNLVSMVRLADTYCGFFINGERNASFALIPGGFPGLPDSYFGTPFDPIPVRTKILETFMDYEENEEKYETLETELSNVLSNSDGQGGQLITASLPEARKNRHLAVLACVMAATSTESILKH